MENKLCLSKKQKKLFILFGTVIAVYLGMKYLLPLFVPFIFAYFFAWLLRPIVSVLHRKLKIPVVIGGTIGVLLFSIVVFTILFFLGRVLFNQIILFFKNIPAYEQYLAGTIDGVCKTFDKMLHVESGSARGLFDQGMNSITVYIQSDLLPRLTEQTIKVAISVAGFFAILLVILVATVLFIKDMEEYKAGLRKSEFYPAVHKITAKLSDTGIAYLKTQLILMSIIATINTIGFIIIKNPYALLIGIFVGAFDAFPVLGSGLILVPWSIIMLLQKNFLAAAIIMTVFVLCQIVREILEPRLLGNRIGIKPIYDMIAMYVGVQLFGVIGFLLGPLSLVIIRTVLKESIKEAGDESKTTKPPFPSVRYQNEKEEDHLK